jgi:hypothetical protein
LSAPRAQYFPSISVKRKLMVPLGKKGIVKLRRLGVSGDDPIGFSHVAMEP